MAALVASALAPASAGAADPGRWTLTGKSTVPLEYYQGGGQRRGGPAQPVLLRDPRRALPMECYYPQAAPGQSDPNNTCRTGSIAVADPQTLQWRYYVKLDPAEIAKAMWVAVSPDGQLLWTQSGRDLLAYRTDDVNPANAAPGGPRIKAVRRVVNARPPSGITGAHFHQGRLFVAGQDNPIGFQVWSLDLATGERRLEIERAVVGESEGIEFFPGLGGILHWIIAPYNTRGPPSEGPPNTSQLLHFVPRGQEGSVPGTARAPLPRILLSVRPRRIPARRWTRVRFLATATIAGRRRPLRGVVIRMAGRAVRTDRFGRASMLRRLPHVRRWRALASGRGLRRTSVRVWVVPPPRR